MLAAVVQDAVAQLDEIRLPIHILLDTRFGDLNENQEELLRDARNAADAMDEALRRLGQVADADRGALPVQRELVQVNDVVRAVLPLANAAAERRGARVDTSLEPGLPRVLADRARLAEALTLLTREAASTAGPERPLMLATGRDSGTVTITIAPPIAEGPTAGGIAQSEAATHTAGGARTSQEIGDTILATRLVMVQGGSLEKTPTGTVVRVGSPPRTVA
jgi:K+-sensing histidine kinase KdpD